MYKLLLMGILARPAQCEFSPPAPKIIPRLLSRRKCSGVVELRSLGSVRPCADSVRPLSCILARRACSFGFASLRNFGQALSRILAFAVVWVAASCSDFVRPPSCILCTFMNALLVSHRASSAVWVATSVHRQPFVPLHRATALCGCLYASLHNGFVWLSLCILA